MPKIAFVGAGSAVFTRNLVGDILRLPELRDDHHVRADGHRRRAAAHGRARHLAADRGARRRAPRVEATTDRRGALDGADYVVTSFQVGGYQPSTVVDFEVPKRYGLRQTIADTLGIGGIMRGLRTIPVLLDVCRDLEELCPDALLLNYVNPMAMLCWAVGRGQPIRTVGLCHSVQGTTARAGARPRHPGRRDRLPRRRHQPHGVLPALRARRRGPLPRAARASTPPELRTACATRCSSTSATSSPSPPSTSPSTCRGSSRTGRADLIERFNVPLDEYPRRCERQIAEWEALRGELEGGGELDAERQHEYGAAHHPRVRDRRAVHVQRQRAQPLGRTGC